MEAASYYFYFLIGIVGVLSYSNKDRKLTSLLHSSKKTDSLYTYKKFISLDSDTLFIETTCLRDSVNSEEVSLENPIVLNQSLIFCHDGKRKKESIHCVRQITQSTYNSGRILMAEDVVYEISVISGKKGSLFVIYGGGGCNACGELYELYDLTGKLISSSYASTTKDYCTYGNSYDVFKKYGIPHNASTGRHIQVYPQGN